MIICRPLGNLLDFCLSGKVTQRLLLTLQNSGISKQASKSGWCALRYSRILFPHCCNFPPHSENKTGRNVNCVLIMWFVIDVASTSSSKNENWGPNFLATMIISTCVIDPVRSLEFWIFYSFFLGRDPIMWDFLAGGTRSRLLETHWSKYQMLPLRGGLSLSALASLFIRQNLVESWRG